MKTGIGQSKYRNLTLFHVVWSVPAKVFLTVTFSIWSILTDYDLFGSDVEQDWSYTVFALLFLLLLLLLFFFLYLNSALFNRVYHIATTFYFVCSKKRPGHPSNPPYLIFRPNWKFLEPEPPPLGSGRPHPPLIWRSGSITAHILSMNAVTVWASGIWLRTRKVKICFHFKSDTSYFHTQVNIRKERWWNSRNCNVSTVFTYVKDKLPVCRTKLCFLDCNVFKFCECLQSG